jgi:hypothetical protein
MGLEALVLPWFASAALGGRQSWLSPCGYIKMPGAVFLRLVD